MKILRCAGLCVLLCLPLCNGFAEGARPSEPVALVYRLQGKATLTVPSEEPRTLRLFDRLPAGTTVEVAPGSRLALAFANGRRYELGERARTTLGPADLSSRSGPVRALPSVPPLPRLLPIADEEQPGLRAGAVRIRAERITGLYPRHGAATLAGATVLRFEAVEGGGKYAVEVHDREGHVIFEAETTSSTVNLPTETLQPGARYGWMVRTVERVGPVARGEADFVTLSSGLAKKRETLRRAVEAAGDGASLALLAEVDRSLGLLAEARDGLRAAARSLPGDAALAEALYELERRLEEEGAQEIGIVVEGVTPRSLGALAGLQVGDVLLSWCRSAADGHRCLAAGDLGSPFDLAEIEIEQVPRGGVRAFGRRAGASATWNLLPGPLDINVRPALPDFLEELHRQAQGLATSGDLDGAAATWRAAAAAAGPAESRLSVWFLWRAASRLNTEKRAAQADAFFAAALEKAEKRGDSSAAWILLSWGQALQKRAVPIEAERSFRRALEFYRRLGPEGLAAATVHHNFCELAIGRDLNAAEAACRQALTIVETAAPHSFAFSAILNSMGDIALERGDLPAAERFFQRALDLDTEIAPGSLASVLSLQMNAVAADGRSDLVTAEDLLRRAKAILDEAEPNGLRLATVLGRLAVVAGRRGDSEAAKDLLLRSLEIHERLDPGGLGVPNTLYNLGVLAGHRGDLDAAQHHFERALERAEKIAPEGSLVSDALKSLALTAQRRGDISAAREFLQRALVINEKVRPFSKQTASVLSGLAALIPDDGDVALAETYFQRAVTILEKLGPAPHGLAENLYNLGRAQRLQRRFDAAAAHFCRAVDTLEIQRGRFGGDTTVFGVGAASFYAACVGARIKIGEQEKAFGILERGRARAFLEQLAERDNLGASELPAELVNQRKELSSAYDDTQSALSDLDPIRDKDRIDELQDRLREIRGLQDELAMRMRRESPRYASLHEPQTLDLAGARGALDPGTVLLSYAVDEDATHLLVVQSAELRGKGIAAFSLPLGEEDLRAAIASFRNLLQNPGSDRRALTAQAQKLYDLLFRPAEHEFAGAARLLVSPDGPLHTLPFAALVRRGSYLTEWKPIHSVLSASVYAEIQRSRRPSLAPAELQLAAFGAPIYPRLSKKGDERPAAAPEVLTAVSRGLSLDPLPSSRQEVEGIASLFPQARTFLGAEATEEKVKALAPQARLLHFACHGLLDESFPLNSALALSIPEKPAPGQDNGLLQAWEIFESLRLDADLVALSACDSGLGKEMGSEGLIGLTRAFQFAGARSVLASVWSVSDVSTADLMKRFYGQLRAGKPKAEALQSAQVALIRSREFSHPYHWAAFQLVGDWQ